MQESVERVMRRRRVDFSVMVDIVEERGRRARKGMLEQRLWRRRRRRRLRWRVRIEVAEASLHV